MRRKQGNARRHGFEPRPYFGGWISRRTCYLLGHLNIPALRGVNIFLRASSLKNYTYTNQTSVVLQSTVKIAACEMVEIKKLESLIALFDTSTLFELLFLDW